MLGISCNGLASHLGQSSNTLNHFMLRELIWVLARIATQLENRHRVAKCKRKAVFNPIVFQAAAKMIKESLDKKFGSSWHAVVGEGYGFELTHEVKNLLYMYFGGTVAVCVWKCSWRDSKNNCIYCGQTEFSWCKV